MDIGLMTDVPDKFVFGGIENAVQRDGQFHDAEVRAEMSARPGESGDEFLTDFACQTCSGPSTMSR
jgi:hypothetical protein